MRMPTPIIVPGSIPCARSAGNVTTPCPGFCTQTAPRSSASCTTRLEPEGYSAVRQSLRCDRAGAFTSLWSRAGHHVS